MISKTCKRNRKILTAAAALLLAVTLLSAGCAKRQIAAISPVDEGTVSAANSAVHAFCDNYTPGRAEELRDFSDMYYPAGIDLSWNYNFPAAPGGANAGGKSAEGEGAETPSYALVYFSRNKDLSEAETYVTAGNSVHINDLLVNTDYYWQVRAVFADKTILSDVFKLHTAHEFRTFAIPSVSNTRDLGGYSVKGGKKVKQGMIIRGANVDNANPEAKRILLDELGIRTDLDLRVPGEGKAGGLFSPLSGKINYVNISAPLYGGIMDEDKQEALAEEIRVFTDPENYPVYFHCAIGRDRTGTLAMLLLGLLGVPEDMIRRDYEMSFLSYSGSADKAKVASMISSGFDPTVNYLKTMPGKTFKDNVSNFLKSIGITDAELEAIRSIMLE